MIQERPNRARIYCDLTQSYSAKGGGIRTFIEEKRRYILEHTGARHCLIIPGESDRVRESGRVTTIEIASPKVPASPNYRLLLRSNAVKKALRLIKPDLIESLDAYNLPWAALAHRAKYPKSALVAGYRTDFPVVYVDKVGARYVGATAASWSKKLAYKYAANLYRRFDAFYTLNEAAACFFKRMNVPAARVLSLGVDHSGISPDARDEDLRTRFNLTAGKPLLIYAGRIDREKKSRVIVDAFKKLPSELGAALVMLGDGHERDALMDECAGHNAHFPGFIADRAELARYLASADIYVSAMEDETFGVSVIEAQAAGLPVVGVRAGAMIDRTPAGLGLLGAPGDSGEFAANIISVWENGAHQMGARARRHVLENFSWDRTFRTLFDDIYPEAFAARGLTAQTEASDVIAFRGKARGPAEKAA